MSPAIHPTPFSQMTDFGYHNRGTSSPAFRGNKKTLHLVMYSGPRVGRVSRVGQADQARVNPIDQSMGKQEALRSFSTLRIDSFLPIWGVRQHFNSEGNPPWAN
jgi:hypothetical protein